MVYATQEVLNFWNQHLTGRSHRDRIRDSAQASFAKLMHHDTLQLELQQVSNHLHGGDTGGSPQGGEVQGAREGIGVAEEQHGGDPATGVLQREARLIHLVLLNLAADKVVHATGGVDLGLELAGDVGQLGALEDVEVVVGGVAAGVTLGANGGT